MKSAPKTFLFLVLAIGCVQISFAQSTAPDTQATTGVATLFARDPIGQSLCFKDGLPGGVIQNGQARNRCSDLNFNSYSANGFSVGIEGGKQGVILDLGTPEELKAKYGFAETVGNGQGFASINVKNGKAMILKNAKTGDLQPITDSAELFRLPSGSYSSIPVRLGHVYLVRVTDRNDKGFEMFAKVLVVAHVPNESVTVRWHLISDNQTAKF